MWIAPALAPIGFLIQLAVLTATDLLFDIGLNPASVPVLGTLAASLGLVVAYGFGRIVCLPLMRFVDRRRPLTLPLVLGCAVGLAALLGSAVPIIAESSPPLPFSSALLFAAMYSAGFVGPLLFAAGVFFAIASRERPQAL